MAKKDEEAVAVDTPEAALGEPAAPAADPAAPAPEAPAPADAPAPAPEEAKPEEAKDEPVVVLSGNCAGELVELPAVEGVTYKQYKCKACGQIVHVGLEHLAEYGLPPQHHKLEEEKQ